MFFNDLQEKTFFSYLQAIFQIAYGNILLTSEDEHATLFKHYYLRTFLPLPSNIQGCESALKDAFHCNKNR